MKKIVPTPGVFWSKSNFIKIIYARDKIFLSPGTNILQAYIAGYIRQLAYAIFLLRRIYPALGGKGVKESRCQFLSSLCGDPPTIIIMVSLTRSGSWRLCACLWNAWRSSGWRCSTRLLWHSRLLTAATSTRRQLHTSSVYQTLVNSLSLARPYNTHHTLDVTTSPALSFCKPTSCLYHLIPPQQDPLSPLTYDIPPVFINPVYALKSTAPSLTMAFIIINSHPQSYCLFC